METTATDIKAALSELRDLPTPVNSWLVETGLDSTDDPAVWVWVILEDEDADFQTRSQLRKIVQRKVLSEAHDMSWVYVRFRGASESV